ncbi:TPA: hypothetical protein DCX16_05810 [bacterium]|nr:hypothetical protein [bacterium]
MKDEYREIAIEWLNKANSDLNFAKASFEEFDDFYSQMCILSHDAVEKYLKAYIVSCGVKPERIHDLVALLNECARLSTNPTDFKNQEEGCRKLNRYYTPLKYPSHYPIVTKEQAKEAIDTAVHISKFIKEQIGV